MLKILIIFAVSLVNFPKIWVNFSGKFPIYLVKFSGKWGNFFYLLKNVNWLYEAEITTILANVLWNTLNVVSYRTKFESVLRRIVLLITGAMSTTATKAIFALLHRLPVELQARKHVLCSAIRLNASHNWNSRPYFICLQMDRSKDME